MQLSCEQPQRQHYGVAPLSIVLDAEGALSSIRPRIIGRRDRCRKRKVRHASLATKLIADGIQREPRRLSALRAGELQPKAKHSRIQEIAKVTFGNIGAVAAKRLQQAKDI